jgi:hypothetical protein
LRRRYSSHLTLQQLGFRLAGLATDRQFQLKIYSKRILIALALVFAGAGVLVFNLLYQEAKTTAMTKPNEEQFIHARQAVREFEDFLTSWTRSLSALAKTDEIVADEDVATCSFARA